MDKSAASQEEKSKTRKLGGKKKTQTAKLWKIKKVEEHKQKVVQSGNK